MQVSLKVLDMQQVAPKLMAAKNLQLAVPGTYSAGVTPVPIQSFDRVIKVGIKARSFIGFVLIGDHLR